MDGQALNERNYRRALRIRRYGHWIFTAGMLIAFLVIRNPRAASTVTIDITGLMDSILKAAVAVFSLSPLGALLLSVVKNAIGQTSGAWEFQKLWEMFTGKAYIDAHPMHSPLSEQFKRAIRGGYGWLGLSILLGAVCVFRLRYVDGLTDTQKAQYFWYAFSIFVGLVAVHLCWLRADALVRAQEKNPPLAEPICNIEGKHKMLLNALDNKLENIEPAAQGNARIINAVLLGWNAYPNKHLKYADKVIIEGIQPFIKHYFLEEESLPEHQFVYSCAPLLDKLPAVTCTKVKNIEGSPVCTTSGRPCPVLNARKDEFDLGNCFHSGAHWTADADLFQSLLIKTVDCTKEIDKLGKGRKGKKDHKDVCDYLKSQIGKYPKPFVFVPATGIQSPAQEAPEPVPSERSSS